MSIWKLRDPSKFSPAFARVLWQAPTKTWIISGVSEKAAREEQRRWGVFLRSCRAFPMSSLHAPATAWSAFAKTCPDGRGSWGVTVQWRPRHGMDGPLLQALGDTDV